MKLISITYIAQPERRRAAAPKSPNVADRRAKPQPSRAAARMRARQGLGDWVETWAKPVAIWVDRQTRRLPRRWHTRLAGCSACSRRRRYLNLLVPSTRDPAAWLSSWRRLRPAWREVFRAPAAASKAPLQGSP